jgi:Na+-driven multidrug efflux pump
VRSGVAMNLIIGGVLIATVYLLARELLSMFVVDPATLDVAHGLLSITLWSYLIFGTTVVLSG